MKRTTFLTGLVAIVARSASGADRAAGPPSDRQWRLVFSDEFDGNTKKP